MKTIDYVLNLLKQVNPAAKYKSHTEHFVILDIPSRFTNNPKFVYYGYFNLGSSASLSLTCFDSEPFNITTSANQSSITQPLMFTDLPNCVNVAFTGYRIEFDMV